MAAKSPRAKATPKEVWTALANDNLTVARELLWIADRSTATLVASLDGGTEPPKPASEADGEQLVRALHARFDAEAEIYSESQKRDLATALESEFLCLLATLRGLASSLLRDAEIHRGLATKEKRGRPRRYARNALETFGGLQLEPKRSPARPKGRPLVVPIPNEALEHFVSDWPKRFGDKDLTETLRNLAICYLKEQNALPDSAWRKEREVDRIVSNLRKRVSAMRQHRKINE